MTNNLSIKYEFSDGKRIRTYYINEFSRLGVPLDFSKIPKGILNGTAKLQKFDIPLKNIKRVDNTFQLKKLNKISYRDYCQILEDTIMTSFWDIQPEDLFDTNNTPTLMLSGIDSLYLYCVAKNYNIKVNTLHCTSNQTKQETEYLKRHIPNLDIIHVDDVEFNYDEYINFCPPLSSEYHYYNLLFIAIGKQLKDTQMILGQGAEHVLQQRIWFTGSAEHYYQHRLNNLNNITPLQHFTKIDIRCPYINGRLALAAWNLDPNFRACNFFAYPQKQYIQNYGIPLPTFEYNQHDILPKNKTYDLVKHLNNWIQNYRLLHFV
jgi:hypothetical protein